jgi:hypothetical protein
MDGCGCAVYRRVMKTRRSDAPRFGNGDLVTVRDVIFSRYSGQTCHVIGTKPCGNGNCTLDKYTVAFENGDQAELWDVQLEKVKAAGPAEPVREALPDVVNKSA